jgi:hypothetical protein
MAASTTLTIVNPKKKPDQSSEIPLAPKVEEKSELDRYERLQTQADKHLKQVSDLYKLAAGLIGTCVTVIAIVAGVFFYSNLREAQRDLKENVSQQLGVSSNKVESAIVSLSNRVDWALQTVTNRIERGIDERLSGPNIVTLIDDKIRQRVDKETSEVISNRIQSQLDPKLNEIARLLSIKLAEITNNIASLDPTNGPIRTVEAHVFFALAKPVTATNHNQGMQVALLRLQQLNPKNQFSNSIVAIDLMTEHFQEQIIASGEQRFGMDFSLRPDPMGFGTDWGSVFPSNGGIPASDMVNGLDSFDLSVFFLPKNAEIVRGFVAVKINSVLFKKFEIPPQRIGDWISIVSPLSRKIPDHLPEKKQ